MKTLKYSLYIKSKLANAQTVHNCLSFGLLDLIDALACNHLKRNKISKGRLTLTSNNNVHI